MFWDYWRAVVLGLNAHSVYHLDKNERLHEEVKASKSTDELLCRMQKSPQHVSNYAKYYIHILYYIYYIYYITSFKLGTKIQF